MVGDEPVYHTFELEPNAWMNCFSEFNNIDREAFNQKLIKEVLSEEREIKHEKGIVGREGLKTQPINKEFTREFHPQPLTEPYVRLSFHTALIIYHMVSYRVSNVGTS